MHILQPSEYDISYFDGAKTTLRHNAGYGKYERWYRKDGEDSLGEYWQDLTSKLKDTHQLAGKKVLEIGCAKGFVVEDLRALGVDAYGLDVSNYAISKASKVVKPYLTVGDAKTYLKNYASNEFDVVFSLRFLECLAEDDLSKLITEMNRISKYQFHDIDETPNPEYYLNQPLLWWSTFDFNKNTSLIAHENGDKVKI